MSIARRIRWLGRNVGVELRRASSRTVPELRLRQFLEHNDVRTVLDVGANDGGFAGELFRTGWSGSIISYEPLPAAWNQLKLRASGNKNWFVAPRMALSNIRGEASFFEAGNSYSSSLLRMTSAHVGAAPRSAVVREIRVQTIPLDDVLADAPTGPHFLKLDVQGAEMLALSGAREGLSKSIIGVQVESSIEDLYEGQPTIEQIDSFLIKRGFALWDIVPGFRDPITMRLLQCDRVYFRIEASGDRDAR